MNLCCRNHPTEVITNYCTREECQLELCATCICQHTQKHGDNGTLPYYENIQQTLKRANDLIEIQRKQLDQKKENIIKFNNSWEEKKKDIFSKIENAKKNVLQQVQTVFDDILNKYKQTVKQEQVKIGMRDTKKVTELVKACTDTSNKLTALQNDIKGPKAAETARTLFTQALPQANQMFYKLTTQLDSLNENDICLYYDAEQLVNIRQPILSLLSLSIHLNPTSDCLDNRLATRSKPVSMQKTYPLMKESWSSEFQVQRNRKPQLFVLNNNSQLIIENSPLSECMNRNSRVLLRAPIATHNHTHSFNPVTRQFFR